MKMPSCSKFCQLLPPLTKSLAWFLSHTYLTWYIYEKYDSFVEVSLISVMANTGLYILHYATDPVLELSATGYGFLLDNILLLGDISKEHILIHEITVD